MILYINKFDNWYKGYICAIEKYIYVTFQFTINKILLYYTTNTKSAFKKKKTYLYIYDTRAM